jgi:GNAT superfamily N-acetyltransferase
MEIMKKEITGRGVKLSIEENGKEVARAFLYVLTNELHKEPFGLMEDVFVEEEFRGKGLGTMIVKALIEEAKRTGCYKLIATSRYSRENVHTLYERLGFKDHGKEFRIDF